MSQQKIVKDERGQEQPTDKKRARQTDQQAGTGKPKTTPMEPEKQRDQQAVGVPSDNKNQINRSRSSTLGEAVADEPFGFERKPMLDKHQQHARKGGDGLRGEDKRQAALEDASTRGESHDVTLGEQRTAHQVAQRGSDVRAPFIKAVDTPPEGLRRERTHPLSPTQGRGGAHAPSGKK